MVDLRITRETIYAYRLLIPLFIFFGVFIFYPLTHSVYLTLNKISLIDLKPEFVGLSNYVSTMSDPVFIQSLYNTLYFTFGATVIGIPIGIAVALMLNENFRGRTFARICLLLPWATPPIVVAIMLKWMLDAQYGIINYVLLATGLVPARIPFFSTPELALNSLIMIFVWKVFPVYAIITLSALQNISVDVMESAKVYGANTFTRFRYVTLPYLRPTIIILLVLSVLLTLIFNFDLILSITWGGPGYATYTLYFYGYITTFWHLNAGYGDTVAYIVMFICLFFCLLILRFRR